MSPESVNRYVSNSRISAQRVDSSDILAQKVGAAASSIDQRATAAKVKSLPGNEIIKLNKESQLVDPTDDDVVELERLSVRKGKVTGEIVSLGLKSSYAYAPEKVKDKEKQGWKNKAQFWKKGSLSHEDKLRHGHNYVEDDMKKKGMTDRIDRSLSSREATVFVNDKTNTVTVSFKGTNPTSVQDIAADVALYDNKWVKMGAMAVLGPLGSGVVATAEVVGQREIKEAEDLIRKVQSTHPNARIVATGHSLGGAKALHTGDKFGIEAVAFNPGPLGKNKKPCQQCTVVRTKGDIISSESSRYTDVEVEAKGKAGLLEKHSLFPGQEEVPDIVKFLFLQLSEMVSTDYVKFCEYENIEFFIQNGHTKAENRLLNLQKDLKNAKLRVADKMIMGLKGKKIDRSSKILSKVVYHRKEFLNFNVAMCICGDVFSQYKDRNCMKVDMKNKQICARLHQRLDHNNPACMCPVDASKGSCGIPSHMDLFTEKVSGLRIPLYEVKKKLPKDVPDVTISGLEKHPSIHDWVLASIRVNSQVSTDGSYLEWIDRIPKRFGKVLRDKCKLLNWKVTMHVKQGSVWKIAQVKFSGLTFKTGHRRRDFSGHRNC